MRLSSVAWDARSDADPICGTRRTAAIQGSVDGHRGWCRPPLRGRSRYAMPASFARLAGAWTFHRSQVLSQRTVRDLGFQPTAPNGHVTCSGGERRRRSCASSATGSKLRLARWLLSPPLSSHVERPCTTSLCRSPSRRPKRSRSSCSTRRTTISLRLLPRGVNGISDCSDGNLCSSFRIARQPLHARLRHGLRLRCYPLHEAGQVRA